MTSCRGKTTGLSDIVVSELPTRVDAEHALLLRQVTDALATTLEPDQAAERLSSLVVPNLADWSVVTLVDDDRPAGTHRSLRHATAYHRDPALRPLAERFARARLTALGADAPLLRSFRSGKPALLRGNAADTVRELLHPSPARELLGRLLPEHIAIFPLPGRHGAVGLLTLYNDAGRGAFTPADLAAAADIANRAGLVLDNARLYRQQRSLAEALQRAQLTDPPALDGLEVAVRYAPAAVSASIGGDWYDAFHQAGKPTFVIGDVAGHDAGAAAMMGQLRALLRGIAVTSGAPPAELLRSVDGAMAQLRLSAMTTAITARLTPPARSDSAWRLRWSNAGHPPPVLLAPGGRPSLLATRPDLPLGVTRGAVRTESAVPVSPGATVLFFTDGLVERRGRVLDDGLDLLCATLEDLASARPTLEQLCDSLLDRLMPDRPDDDVALLAVRPRS